MIHYLSVGSDNIATIVAWEGEPKNSAFQYVTVRPEEVESLAHDHVAPVIERKVDEMKSAVAASWPNARIFVQKGPYNPFDPEKPNEQP